MKRPSDALIIVDIQPMFIGDMTGECRDGEKIIPLVNEMIGLFDHVVVACHNWMRGSMVTQPHVSLRLDHRTVFVHKYLPNVFGGYVYDSHRPEKDNNLPEHSLAPYFKRYGVKRAYVCGLFTEYCVMDSALGAVSQGFKSHLIVPACGCANENASDKESALVPAALESMSKNGVSIWTKDIIKTLTEELAERQKEKVC